MIGRRSHRYAGVNGVRECMWMVEVKWECMIGEKTEEHIAAIYRGTH